MRIKAMAERVNAGGKDTGHLCLNEIHDVKIRNFILCEWSAHSQPKT